MSAISLQSYVKGLDFSNQLKEVNELFESATGEVSFWGKRVVRVEGYHGTVSIQSLVRKILQADRIRTEADDLTLEERISGIDIVNKCRGLYSTTDSQIKTTHCFTRFLNWVREFYILPYTPRFYIEDTGHCLFCGFSKDKFSKTFGNPSDYPFSHSPAWGGNVNQTVIAKAESIQEKCLIKG